MVPVAAVSLLASLGGASSRVSSSSSNSNSISSTNSDDIPSSRSTHELLFANRSVSIILLLLCFCWTLMSVLAPKLLMRQEQFSRLQIISLGIWHAFSAGLLLSAAWLLFLPNMLAVADMMHLPTPALPFILLFLSLLVPLALDKAMLWLATLKADVPSTSTGGGNDFAGTPRSARNDQSSLSQPSTPRREMTPQHASRRGSAAIGGYQADSAAAFEERKSLIGHHGRTPSGQPLTGNDIEGAPLLTPKGTPRSGIGPGGIPIPSSTPTRTAGSTTGGGWYGSAAARSVDASSFKLHQSYLGRCAYCKEDITSARSAAYHSVGCPLKNFHAFSFSSRWMQGLRGRRSLQRDLLVHDEAASGGEATLAEGTPTKRGVGWSLAAYVLVLSVYNLCLAGGINLQEAARLYSHAHAIYDSNNNHSYTDPTAAAHAHASWIGEICRVALVALVMFCFTAFYGFSLGLMIVLHRIPLYSFRAITAMTFYALSLPGAIALNYFLSSSLSPNGIHAYGYYLLVCQCFCVGILIYAAFLDLLLEEWARKDAIWGKYIGFTIGAAVVIGITIFAP
jgi:hypothetical protein